MKSNKIRNIIALLLNILMVIFVTIAISSFFTGEGLSSGVGNMDYGGIKCLIFFTNQSNILAAIGSLLLIPFNIKVITNGEERVPKVLLLFKFVGTTAVTVTLMVVLLFLGPIIGYVEMFEGNCFFLHLICPLMAIFNFCFCEKGIILTKKQALLGVLPTLLYGFVYLTNVIFRKTWVDFYHFNIGGYWYVSFIVMLLVTYLFAIALKELHNLAEHQKS